jgi:hypothetical protein
MLTLRAASSQDFSAQVVQGVHDDRGRVDGGLLPDEEWEDDDRTTFKRFREWSLWQGVFDDLPYDGKYTFTVESAYLIDGESDPLLRVVEISLSPTRSSWELELKVIRDDEEPVSLLLFVEDYDPAMRPEEEYVEPHQGEASLELTCFERLFDD